MDLPRFRRNAPTRVPAADTVCPLPTLAMRARGILGPTAVPGVVELRWFMQWRGPRRRHHHRLWSVMAKAVCWPSRWLGASIATTSLGGSPGRYKRPDGAEVLVEQVGRFVTQAALELGARCRMGWSSRQTHVGDRFGLLKVMRNGLGSTAVTFRPDKSIGLMQPLMPVQYPQNSRTPRRWPSVGFRPDHLETRLELIGDGL